MVIGSVPDQYGIMFIAKRLQERASLVKCMQVIADNGQTGHQ